MDGRTFLDKVMQDSFLAPIPVVIVSAIADKINTNGAVGFLKKPIDIEVILKLVQRFCEGNTSRVSSPDQAQSHHVQ
jgi:CheY-like chemotaxis protein